MSHSLRIPPHVKCPHMCEIMMSAGLIHGHPTVISPPIIFNKELDSLNAKVLCQKDVLFQSAIIVQKKEKIRAMWGGVINLHIPYKFHPMHFTQTHVLMHFIRCIVFY